MDNYSRRKAVRFNPPTKDVQRDETHITPLPLAFDSMRVEELVRSTKEEHVSTPHRAELSGASSNPKLRLMGIPRELRDSIFHHVLVFHREIHLDFSCIMTWADAEQFYCFKRRKWTRMLAGNRPEFCQEIEPAILRVCKEAYEEGRLILYGENRWFSTHARAFETLILDYPTTPGGKAALIRDLTIWPKASVDKAYSEMPLAQFIEFIGTRMLALQHLQLVLSYNVFRDTRHWLHMDAIENTVVHMAAGITSQHPCLRKAVLSSLSGRLREDLSISRRLRQFEVAFIVDIFPVGGMMGGEPVGALSSGWSSEIDDLKSKWYTGKDTILNCPMIRATQSKDNPDLSAPQFILPDTATSSEPLDPSPSAFDPPANTDG